VERPGRKAVLGELELQRRDVPAGLPEPERAAAEPVAREAAQRAACLGADDAVDREAGVRLQPPDRLLRRRAREPVDRARIEPARVQADLEGGYARICCRGLGDEGRGG